MDETSKIEVPGLKPLRIWPPIVLILAIPLLRALPFLIENGPPNLWMASAFGPLLCSLLIVLWWVLISRASIKERLLGLFGLAIVGAVIGFLMHKSMLGPAMIVLTIPMGVVAFAAGGILFGRLPSVKRTIIALLMATIGFGCSMCLRNEGMWGDFKPEFLWRWNPSAEETMLAEKDTAQRPDANTIATLVEQVADNDFTNPEWPAFRGADRSGRAPGIQIEPWTEPPTQLWKVRVGPAWSSFAVAGKLLFTQEQRGDDEVVACYAADTGVEVWTRSVPTRFEDPLGGPGPRATPTVGEGGVFAMGANGTLLRLDARTGDVVWEKNICDVAKRDPPHWGYSSSPLVTSGKVIVYGGGDGDRGVLAFDAETGEESWSAETGGHSYSSPQICNIVGQDLVVMLTDSGMTVLNPETGEERLDHDWQVKGGYRALQPAVINTDSLLIPTGDGFGTRRVFFNEASDQLHPRRGAPLAQATLMAEEGWTSRHMKADFNDLVVHNGYAYGFDGSRATFTCIDLENGKRVWRAKSGTKYGKGQILLIPDSNLLLIATEYGDVVLVKAQSDGHEQVATFKAIEGKTWNHPVVIGNRLYIRNAQEAACFEW